MSCKSHCLLFPLLLLIATLTQAATITIDFDNLSGMPVTIGGPIPLDSQLSDQYLDDYGAVFSSGASYAAITNLGPTQTTSEPNALLATYANGTLTNTVPINVSFFKPGDPTVPYVTSYVSARTDLLGTNGLYSATLSAYDLSGDLLGAVTVPDNNGQLLSFSAPGIHSFVLTSTAPDTAGIAFDDVAFEETTVVPIPAALWLFASGIAGIGVLTRGKQNRS
jgi:hypothetical protein